MFALWNKHILERGAQNGKITKVGGERTEVLLENSQTLRDECHHKTEDGILRFKVSRTSPEEPACH